MINSINSASFSRLKPLCVNLLADCSCENIEKLKEAVNELDSESIQLLQEFILVPFQAHLNIKLSEKVTIKCIEFFTLVFKKSSVKQWSLFVRHFALLMSKICDPEDITTSITTRCEELKLSICENVLWLVKCSSVDVLNEMYSLSFRPHLGYAFFVLNTLLRLEKSKTLIKAVLSAIGALVYSEDYVEKKELITEYIASEALASCLPGISVVLQKVICDDKQGHSVIIMALSVLTDLIILVVGDESYKRDIANDSSNEIYHIAYKCGKYNSDSDHIKDSIPVVIKHKTWFKSASEKLEILIKNITALSFHSHWNVRLKYLKCMKLLLFKCTETLENCIPVVLPSVFGLSVDNNENISSFAKYLLVSFSELSENKSYSLKSVIHYNIEKLVSNLIRYKFTANDDKKLATLKNLLGYIEMSSLSFNKQFSMIHLERIVLTLITLLEFDISDLSLVEEVPNIVIDNFDVENPIFLKKKFKFFKNEEILSTICKLCCSLGNIENSQVLIDYLLDKLLVTDLYELPCIFIIGSIIKGFSSELNTSEKYSGIINNVVEVFLSSTLFDAPIYRKDDTNVEVQLFGHSDRDIPDSVLNKNKMQICLLLEAIAWCSECLKTDFKFHLMKVLCPVMEKAGSRNFSISYCGKLCLYFISKSCNYTSIKELIKDNADYITNVLLINFHQYLYKSEMITVLHTVITQCDAEAIMLFRDLIFKILDFVDYNQDKSYSLMVVLNLLVTYIRNWFPCKKRLYKHKSLPLNTSGKSLRTLVLEYMNLKKCEITPQDFKDIKSENISTAKSEDAGDNIPLHINIVCDIFKRCILLQSSENRYLRMLILETVESCILALQDFENQLHPLVHEFWSPFLKRFAEDSLVLKAFSVLLTIANECGDFIQHRSLKDILPKIELFLQTEHHKSALKCNFKHYQWTNDHSLQILVLSEIGDFCTKLDIDDKELNAVVNVCLLYLEKEQPKTLQDAAVKSLKALATINSDSIYFYWNLLCSEEKTLIPPSNNLLELSFSFSKKLMEK